MKCISSIKSTNVSTLQRLTDCQKNTSIILTRCNRTSLSDVLF